MQKVIFKSAGLDIEGRLREHASAKAAVITHPHPLYGGDMHNLLVVQLARVYQEAGWTTLRFNFRGTGGSQGTYAHGEGEQEDLQAAVAYLRQLGYTQIDLAGYSFGAWIIARWLGSRPPDTLRSILVSPPVAHLDFSAVSVIPGLLAVITGELDDLAPAERLQSLVPGWQADADLIVIPGSDHFFMGRSDDLKQAVARAIAVNRISNQA